MHADQTSLNLSQKSEMLKVDGTICDTKNMK